MSELPHAPPAGAERAETPASAEEFAELRAQMRQGKINTCVHVSRERAALEQSFWYFLLLIAAFSLGFCWVAYVSSTTEAG